MSWRIVPEEFLISVLSALSIKYTPKIYMWGSTMLAGNEAGFWHFPGCHFGEDHQETLPSVSGVLVRDPAASHDSPLPGGDAPRGTIPGKSLCEHLLVKSSEAKMQTARPVWIQYLQCRCLRFAQWALQGDQYYFLNRENIRYPNPFSVVTALSDHDFALSLWQLQEKQQEEDQCSTSALPARNCFKNSVSWTPAFRECLEIINS